ncbi:hypothetical protein [Streptomyces sp. NPDC048338]|uniref:hypothetical protein n=1 Tax=Streptomyces sp. NPDC048338 TaxID=3365536 RepID=UPI003716FC14
MTLAVVGWVEMWWPARQLQQQPHRDDQPVGDGTGGLHQTPAHDYLHIDIDEAGSTAYDVFRVQVNGTTLATKSNANAASGYVQQSIDLTSYAGQQITLTFTAAEDSPLQTSIVLDDVTLQGS